MKTASERKEGVEALEGVGGLKQDLEILAASGLVKVELCDPEAFGGEALTDGLEGREGVEGLETDTSALAPSLLSIQEAADFLGVSTKTLRRWEANGVLKPRRTAGNQRRYTVEELEATRNRGQVLVSSESSAISGNSESSVDQKIRESENQLTRSSDVSDSLNHQQSEYSDFSGNNKLGHINSEDSEADVQVLDNEQEGLEGVEGVGGLEKAENEFPSRRPVFHHFFGMHQMVRPFAAFVVGLLTVLTLGGFYMASEKFPQVQGLKASLSNVLAKIEIPRPSDTPFDKGGKEVLQASTRTNRFTLKINVPSIFGKNATFREGLSSLKIATFSGGIVTNNANINAGTGRLTASNVIYSITAGQNVTITGGQNPVISAVAPVIPEVPSFENIKVGSTTLAAATKDTLQLAGSGTVSLSVDSSTKKITITGAAAATPVESGWTDDGTTVRLTTSTDKVGIGTTSPSTTLHVVGTGTFSSDLTVGGALSVTGGVTLSTFSSNGGLLYTNGSGVVAQTAVGSSGECLTSSGGGSPAWSSCSGAANNVWQRNNGALAPLNITDDLLLGATSTGSAKFAFYNVAGGTPTASVSANSGNNALYLTGDGTLATTNRQTLTIGNSSAYNTTGDVLIHPNGTGKVAIGTSNISNAILTVKGSGSLGVRVYDSTEADSLDLYHDGTNAVLLSNSGNLLFGAAGNRIDLANVGSQAYITFGSGDELNWNYEDGVTNLRRIRSGVVGTDGAFTTSRNVGVGTTNFAATLDVRASTATFPIASISGSTNAGFASLVVDNSGTGDLFTASKSGATKFTILNNGNIQLAGTTNFLGTLASAATGAQTWTLPDATGTICLSTGNCAGGAGGSKWTDDGAVTYLSSTTDDLAVGGSTLAASIFGIDESAGTFYFASDNSANPTFTFEATDSDTADFGFNTNDSFFFSGANVGIGTTAPTALFDVAGAASVGGQLTFRSGTAQIQSTANETLTIGGNTTGNIVINAGSDSITLSDNTTVSGNFTMTGTTFTGTSLTSITGGATAIDFTEFDVAAGTGAITINDGGDLGFVSVEGSVFDINSLDFVGAGAITAVGSLTLTPSTTLNLNSTGDMTLDSTTDIILDADGADVILKDAGTEFARFTNSSTDLVIDAVGNDVVSSDRWTIGSQTPTTVATLDVKGLSGTLSVATVSGATSFAGLVVDNSGVGDIFTASSSGLNRFVVKQDGNVGIGTTMPVQALGINKANNTVGVGIGQETSAIEVANPSSDAVGSGYPRRTGLYFSNNYGINTSRYAGISGIVTGSSGTQQIGALIFSTKTLVGDTELTERMRIDNSGNLGVGTTSPTALLDVAGAASVGGQLKFRSGTAQIQSTVMQTLTLGGDTTGNIILAPRNSVAGAFVAPSIDNRVDLGSSPSARFRSLYLGPGSLHIQCTTDDGCGQGLDYAMAIDTASGELIFGVNGATSTGNPLLQLSQGGRLKANGNLEITGSITTTATSGTQGYWQRNSGALTPSNITDDFLLGATATSSARFAFTNAVGPGTPVASISATTTGLALSGDGSIQSLRMGTLTLGGSTTGNIVIDSGSSSITLSDATTASSTLTVAGALAANGGITFDASTDTVGAHTAAGTYNMNSNIITNIGSTGTAFSSNGALAITLDGAETALTVDNGSQASSIFVAEDNNSAVFTIADGGNVTMTGTLAVNGDTITADGATLTINAAGAVDIQDNLTADSLTLDTGALAINNSGGITSDQATLIINASGTVDVDDVLNANSITSDAGVSIAASNSYTGAGAVTLSSASNNNLTLTAQGSGDTIITSDFDTPVLVGTSSNTPAVLSVSGGIANNAAFIVNNTNSGDLIAASASGTTKFVVNNSGDIVLSGTTRLTNAGVGTFAATTTIGTQSFNTNSITDTGALTINATGDLTLDSTTDVVLDADGADVILKDAGTEFARFTNSSTDLIIDAVGNDVTSSDRWTIGSQTAGAGKLTVTGAETGKALAIFDETGDQAIFTASASGTTRFTIANDGDITMTGNVITASSLDTLTTAATIGWGGATTLTFTSDNATINGSDASNGDLTLQGTTDSTRTSSYVLLQPTAGSVGINTTSPTAVLDVAGTASVSGGLKLTTTPVLQSTAMQTLTLGGDTTGHIAFAPGNTTTMTLTSAGFVGIGTAAPASELEVTSTDSNSQTILTISNTGTGGSDDAVLALNAAGGNWQLNANDQSNLFFLTEVTNNVKAFTITGGTAPLVGINTGFVNASRATLDVRGLHGTFPVASVSGATSFAGLMVDQSGVGDIFTASKSGATHFVISNGGNVGIGTAAPTAVLDVNGTASVSGAFKLYGTPTIQSTANQTLTLGGDTTGHIAFAAGGSGVDMTLTSAGSLGIGTAAPGARLHVSGGEFLLDNGREIRFYDTDGSTARTVLTVTNAGNTVLRAANSSGRFDLRSQNDTTFLTLIDSSGFIGTGNVNTSPLASFDIRSSLRSTSGTIAIASVSGTTSFAAMAVDNNGLGDLFTASKSGATHFVVKNSGRVGVGTATPNQLLELSAVKDGTLRLASTQSSSSWTADTDTAGQIQFYTNDVSGSGANVIGFVKSVTTATAGNLWALTFGTSTNNAAATEKMRILDNGNVGIGDTTPDAALDVNYASANTSTTTPVFTLDTPVSGSLDQIVMDFRANNTQKGSIRVDENGNFVINAEDSGRVYVGHTDLNAGGNGLTFTNYGAGTLQTDATGNVSVSSDERLKDIEGNFARGLSDILGLDPILYKWKSSTGMDTISTYAGFSAQNVQQHIPEAVNTDRAGYLTLSDRPILGALVNSTKELNTKIDNSGSLIATINNAQVKMSNDLQSLSATASGEISDLKSQISNLQQQISNLSSQVASNEADFLNQQLTIDNLQLIMNASSAAELGLDKLNVNEATVSGTLDVLGRATFTDVGVTGKVNVGLLTINGLNDDGAAEINTTAEPLKLQSHGLYGLDILDGKVTIAANGDMNVDGELTVKKLKIDTEDVASASLGEGTIPVGSTSVTIQTSAVTSNSKIFLTPKTRINLPLSVTSQTSGDSFRVELPSAVAVPVKFNWWIIN